VERLDKQGHSSLDPDGTCSLQGVKKMKGLNFRIVGLQIPAAWLASKFGFKRVYGLSMLLAGVLTLLFPLAARQAVTTGPRAAEFSAL
jgi:hypothetical protein